MNGLTEGEKNRILQYISLIPQYNSCGIVFYSEKGCEVLRPSTMPKGFGTWIILILQVELNNQRQSLITNLPLVSDSTRDEKIKNALINAGINCGSFLLAGTASVIGISGAIVSGGTSIPLTILSWTSAAASLYQCGVSSARVLNEFENPDANREMDSLSLYNNLALATDIISLLSISTGFSGVIRKVIALNRATGKGLVPVIRGLSRADKKRLAREVSGVQTSKEYKMLVRANKLPKLIKSEQVDRLLIEQLLNSVNYSLDLYGQFRGGIAKKIGVFLSEE